MSVRQRAGQRRRGTHTAQDRADIAIYQRSDLRPVRSDRQTLGVCRPACEHGEISDSAVRLGETFRVDRRLQYGHEQAGFGDHGLSHRAGSKLHELPRLLLARTAGCDCQPGGADIRLSAMPFRSGRQDGDIEIQTGGAVECLVSPVPAERHRRVTRGEQVRRGHRLGLRCGGRDVVPVGQIGVELDTLDERGVVEVEVRRVDPRIRPRHTVVHAEQQGRIVRGPGVDESPLRDPTRAVSLGERLGCVEEFAETPRLIPPSGWRWHAGIGEQLSCCRTRNFPTTAPGMRTARRYRRTSRRARATLSDLISAANLLSCANIVLRSSSTPRSASPE